jgi:hypothetical protein
VLLVEDDEDYAALEALEQDGADLVVLDMRLPRFDGLTVVAGIQAYHPSLPVSNAIYRLEPRGGRFEGMSESGLFTIDYKPQSTSKQNNPAHTCGFDPLMRRLSVFGVVPLPVFVCVCLCSSVFVCVLLWLVFFCG